MLGRAALSLALLAGFYLLGLAVAAGLLWVALQLSMSGSIGQLRLVWVCVATAGVLLWSLRPRIDHFVEPGPRLTEEDQPELFAVLAAVSRAAGERMPADVFVVDDCNAAVTNRGGVMGFGGHRVMLLGLPLMQLLSIRELQAVLAHEFGHFHGGDTALVRVVYQTRIAIARTCVTMRGRLIDLLFYWYGHLYLRLSAAVSRSQEFAADAFAGRIASRRALASVIRKLEDALPALVMYRVFTWDRIVAAGFRPSDVEGFGRVLATVRFADPSDLRDDEAHDAFDSHPDPAARIRKLMADNTEAADDDTPRAISLFKDVPLLEERLASFGRGDAVPLIEIAWEDVAQRVHAPAWRRTVDENLLALADMTFESLPTSEAAAAAAGRRTGTPMAKLADASEVASKVTGAIVAAISLRLCRDGWRADPIPFDMVFERDGVSQSPASTIPAVLLGNADALVGWLEFCRVADLRGPLVEPYTTPAVEVRDRRVGEA